MTTDGFNRSLHLAGLSLEKSREINLLCFFTPPFYWQSCCWWIVRVLIMRHILLSAQLLVHIDVTFFVKLPDWVSEKKTMKRMYHKHLWSCISNFFARFKSCTTVAPLLSEFWAVGVGLQQKLLKLFQMLFRRCVLPFECNWFYVKSFKSLNEAAAQRFRPVIWKSEIPNLFSTIIWSISFFPIEQKNSIVYLDYCVVHTLLSVKLRVFHFL